VEGSILERACQSHQTRCPCLFGPARLLDGVRLALPSRRLALLPRVRCECRVGYRSSLKLLHGGSEVLTHCGHARSIERLVSLRVGEKVGDAVDWSATLVLVGRMCVRGRIARVGCPEPPGCLVQVDPPCHPWQGCVLAVMRMMGGVLVGHEPIHVPSAVDYCALSSSALFLEEVPHRQVHLPAACVAPVSSGRPGEQPDPRGLACRVRRHHRAASA
jgi:hypothetical protein